MSDFAGGPPPGMRSDLRRDSSGALPVVLLAALATVLLIGVTLGAVAITSDSGSGAVQPAAVTAAKERVRLAITFEGSGKGKIEIAPGDVLCTRTCTRRFVTGTSLVAVAEAAEGSTFDGWGHACDGKGRCSFVIDEDRSLKVTFETDERRAAELCREERDPACAERPPERPVRSDCLDGRDNDRDGLTDAAQDPGCDEDNTEAESAAPDAAPPPPAVPGDCADGRDNDADGLTDTEQDPDCLEGDTESGTNTSTATSEQPRAPRDCGDGRDNDGDGLIDTAQDPGCEADRTEAD